MRELTTYYIHNAEKEFVDIIISSDETERGALVAWMELRGVPRLRFFDFTAKAESE